MPIDPDHSVFSQIAFIFEMQCPVTQSEEVKKQLAEDHLIRARNCRAIIQGISNEMPSVVTEEDVARYLEVEKLTAREKSALFFLCTCHDAVLTMDNYLLDDGEEIPIGRDGLAEIIRNKKFTDPATGKTINDPGRLLKARFIPVEGVFDWDPNAPKAPPLDPSNPIYAYLEEHYSGSEERQAIKQDVLDVIQGISDRKMKVITIQDLMRFVPQDRISDRLMCVVMPMLKERGGLLETAYFIRDEDGTEHRLDDEQANRVVMKQSIHHPVTGVLIEEPDRNTAKKWLVQPGHFAHYMKPDEPEPEPDMQLL